ncbi:RagB/SusD family nutrient uptake outer membrane protein [Fulvivirga sediminis]|uniref:RagB/SusD family nutrient uptake outer membrane protein n=1 Tax=Fulvivirga sediminis TaxID=2803949 RepID=A0A937F7V6_9BACT|nr:RagB/SusD family nutrient uptake outer membrane protein [Fulvivirga sediminis]MBL3655608.1 RagB/SusD family nutrient uptake outer membrane protein [Fulvivirga sediminis]
MKTKKTLYILWAAILSIGVMSCSDDFLELPPEASVVDENFYQNDNQLLAATAPLYNLGWFDYNDKASYNLGDFRGGSAYSAYNDRENVEFNTTANTPENVAAWRAFYNVVAQANVTIYNINQFATEDVSEEMKTHCIAEARFMRALAYRYLVMNWEEVPVIVDNIKILDNPYNVKRNTVSSVWKFITHEFRAAARDLPETPRLEGRVTKWAAEGMLARTYLTRAGVPENYGLQEERTVTRDQAFLDSAKYFADRVINLSGASLLTNYADLFRTPYDNNPESLFSLQWVFVDANSWGTQNSTPAYLTHYAELGNNGDGWGGDKGATFWMLSLYDGFNPISPSGDTLKGHTADARLKATFMLPGMVYDELAYQDGANVKEGYKVPFNGGDGANALNYAAVKKYVVGRLDPEEGTKQFYSHDTYMLRLAEIYLIYAEAVLGNNESTTDGTALEYFNRIHERATRERVTSITYKDIFEERVKEFAMEGMIWYDLVRLHYYNPTEAYKIIELQDRGIYFIEPNEVDNPTEWTIYKTLWDDNRSFNASSGNFKIPLPAVEVSIAPNLLQDPVPYDFNE